MTMRCLAVAVAVLAVAVSTASAQSMGPYDLKYKVFDPPAGGVPLHSAMSASSPVVATLPPDASGMSLSWCRPDLPFEAFRFGDDAYKRLILKGSWCEVIWKGTKGNIEGKYLTPD